MFGDVAQLVERMNGIHEVGGSTPLISTSLRSYAGYAWLGRVFRSQFFLRLHGAVAQLVERMGRIHEATGSNPVSSTNLRQGYGWHGQLFWQAVF